MDDTMRNTLLSQSRMQKQKNNRHLQTDHKSVGTCPDVTGTCHDQLGHRIAWGTGRNDQQPTGLNKR